jgi:endonuclease/exonuclease/phosphatase (EEP) superfamily protein YafD
LAAVFRRRSLWPLIAAAIVTLVPLAGFTIPWARLLAHGSPTVRVLTCNVKGHGNNNERLESLIRQSQADIVALQGCWNESHVRWPEGWHAVRHGELIVASRFRLQLVMGTSHSQTDHIQPRANLLFCIATLPEGQLRFATVHLQSPHYGIASVLDRRTGISPSRSNIIALEIDARWQESEEVAARLANECRPDIVVGDLNLPVESPIYRSYWATWWNAFSSTGWGFGGTEWPKGAAGICFGIRIDHILSGPLWRPYRCWVGPDIGSDHLPLIADLEWKASAGEK